MIIISKLAAMNIIFQLALAKQSHKSQIVLAKKRLMEISDEIHKLNSFEDNINSKIVIDFINKYLTKDLIMSYGEYEILCSLQKIFQQYIPSDIPVDSRTSKSYTHKLKITTQDKIKFIFIPQISRGVHNEKKTISDVCVDMTFENDEWKISGFDITNALKN